MAKPRKGSYTAGDQIHFLVSEGFAPAVNRFHRFCDDNAVNFSEAIRRSMVEWLERQSGETAEPERITGGTIEDVFVIYKDGALLAHATRHMIPNFDLDIFSSMLTLIQGFVTDSFTDLQDTGIKMIEFGGRKILIEPGRSVEIILAVVWSGDSEREDIEKMAHSILYDIDFTFGRRLRDFDGNLNKLRGMRELILKAIE